MKPKQQQQQKMFQESKNPDIGQENKLTKKQIKKSNEKQSKAKKKNQVN